MLIKKLEKPIVLYKEQYDRLAINLFGSSLIDRLSMEMDGIIFKTKYMLKNNLDIDKIPEMNDIFGDKVIQMRKCVTAILQELLVLLDHLVIEYALCNLSRIKWQFFLCHI